MEITISKLVALGLVVLYALAAIFSAGLTVVPGVLILLAPPLALIWFADELSEFTGYVGRGGHVDRTSPEFLVAAFGWLVLIGLPVYWMFFSGN